MTPEQIIAVRNAWDLLTKLGEAESFKAAPDLAYGRACQKLQAAFPIGHEIYDDVISRRPKC